MCVEILTMVLLYFNIIILKLIVLKKRPLFSCYRRHLRWQILTNNLYDNFFVQGASYKIHPNLSSVIKCRKVAHNGTPFWVRESWFSPDIGSSQNLMPEISLFWQSAYTFRNRRNRQYYQNDKHFIIYSNYFPNPFRYRASNVCFTISNEMQCWWKMKKIGWPDHVGNEEVLQRVKKARNIL